MKKLLWIKDHKEFWKVFNQERMRERRKLRPLSFRKKLEMMRIKTGLTRLGKLKIIPPPPPEQILNI
jgi:hypothetical protein